MTYTDQPRNQMNTTYTNLLFLQAIPTPRPRAPNPQTHHTPTPQPNHIPYQIPAYDDELASYAGYEDDAGYDHRARYTNDEDRGLRIELPEFDGGINPDDFLEWVHEIERVFEYKDYTDEKRCKLAVLKFKDYASLWYENLKKQRDRDGKERVCTWTKLKRLLMKRFLPPDHKQELYQKLNSCCQEKMSVSKYILEFEKLMIRTDCAEPQEQSITRFLGGLNRDIAHAVEFDGCRIHQR